MDSVDVAVTVEVSGLFAQDGRRRGDTDRAAAGHLQRPTGALCAGIAVVESPVDPRGIGWYGGAVGIGDLAQDVVDVGGGRDLAVGIGK